MKVFTIELDTLKMLVETMNLFKSPTNSLQFVIGTEDRTAKEHPELLASKVIAVNGTMMCERVFYSVRPEDYDPDESLVYAKFNVKAASFLNCLNALLAYAEDVVFTVSDGKVELASGKHAVLSEALVSENEVEPLLPQDYATKAVASFAMEGNRFVDLLRRGCGAIDNDGGNYTDRALFTLADNRISANSTDSKCVLKAWSDKVQVKFLLNLIPYAFGKKCAGMDAAEQKAFGTKLLSLTQRISPANKDDADKAAAKKELDEMAKENGVDLNTFDFCVLAPSLPVMRKCASGVPQVMVAVTDNHLYMNAGALMATFTLGTPLANNIYVSMEKLRNGTALAKCVVDVQELMNGLNISFLGMTEATQDALRVTMDEGALVMSCAGRTIRTPFVEKEGVLSQVDFRLNPYVFKRALSSMSNGNLAIIVRDDDHAPIEVYNGSLSEPGSSYALVFRVVLNSKDDAEEKDSTDDNEE